MKKKLKALFWALALLISVALYVMPRMVQSSIPSIYYVTPNQKTYENVVNCTGTVQAEQVQAVILDSPIVPAQVHVAVGDRVNRGDLLVTVDEERTSNVTQPALRILQELVGDAIPTSTDSIDWVSLAASYGLTATVSGESISYEQQVQELLEGMGVLSTAQTAGMFVSPVQQEITAPLDGVVTDVSVQPGITAQAGRSIVTITDDSQYKVTASVSESDISAVQVGDRATVKGVGFGGSVYYGDVVKIHPTARKLFTGTATETVVDVEIRLNRTDSRLKPGFTAKVEIAGGDDYQLLTVPYEAIRQDENNDEYVYIYEDGKIKKTLVTTGRELTNEVQILDGLTHESIVVYNPGDITKEGTMIHIKGRADVH